MQIFTGTLNSHAFRYANDNGDNFSEPDAWKYKLDNGTWSLPFDTFDAMLNAAEDSSEAERYCRCGHPQASHSATYCRARIGITCLCSEFRETHSNMQREAPKP